MATKQTLYLIQNEMSSILAQADEEGELPGAAIERIEQLEMAWEDKIDGYAKWYASLNARAVGLKGELDRIAELHARAAAAADAVWDKIHSALVEAGRKKVETSTHVLTVAKNGQPTVKIAPGATIPSQFLKRKIEDTLDKAKVLEAFKNNLPIPSYITVEQGTHLRIK